MHRLGEYPLEDPPEVARLRAALANASNDPDAAISLGLALSRAGCNYEASFLLRPLRASWKATPAEAQAQAALAAQAWWNKHGLEFARLKGAGDRAGALTLLDTRATDYWDQPPLLMHLSEFGAEDLEYDLAAHLLHRVAILADRGLPKMDMSAFAYVPRAGLVDLLLRRGQAADARAAYDKLTPNPGNAMGHQILGIRTLVAAGEDDQAMEETAELLITAEAKRSGYSREIRLDFVGSSADLDRLRSRPDWPAMLDDPRSYLSERRSRG
ncbi:MAG: hypothetical protein OEN23_14245 [Paracoccaceae bacterium]|nr:hypothetical protein [Paracoccaceae bacterium]